jgi:hypothetical protein
VRKVSMASPSANVIISQRSLPKCSSSWAYVSGLFKWLMLERSLAFSLPGMTDYH